MTTQLGFISRLVRIGLSPAVGQPVQLIGADSQPARIYNDASGLSLYSADGRMTADANGAVRCFVPDGQTYSFRMFAADGSVQTIAENIHPVSQIDSSAPYVSGLAESGLLTPAQSMLNPVGVAVIGTDGRVYDANGVALATVANIGIIQAPILDDGVQITPTFTAVNFQGEGVTAGVDGNGVVNVVIPTHRNEVRSNGTLVSSVTDKFDFRGPVSVTAQGTSVVVTVTEPPHLIVKDHGTQVTPGAASISFAGDLTVQSVNNEVEVSLVETPRAIQHHGVTVNTDVSRLNIEGNGATVSSAGSTVTLTIPSTAVVVHDEGTQVGQANTLRFTGPGVSASSTTTGVVEVNVSQPAISVRDSSGATVQTAPSAINFTGAGVEVSSAVSGLTINIPGTTLPVVKVILTDYTIQADDNGQALIARSATPITVTIPASGIPDAFVISLLQDAAGTVTFARAPGVNLDSHTHSFTTKGDKALVTLLRTGTSSYVLAGQLTPPINVVSSVAGRTGDVQLTAADVSGSVERVNGFSPGADGNVILPAVAEATITAVGLVQLAGALGGTAAEPTALGYADAAALQADLVLKSPVGHTHYASEVSIPLATAIADGLLSAADKTKINALPTTTVTQYTDAQARNAAGTALFSSSLSVVHSAATGTTQIEAPAATSATAGFLSASDKAKLDNYPASPINASIYTDEQARDAAAALIVNGIHSGIAVSYDDAQDVLSLTSLPPANATQSAAGLLTAADKTKLDTYPAVYIPVLGSNTYTDEQAQDAAAAMLGSGVHSGISVSYDDANGRMNLIVTGNPGGSAATNLGVVSSLNSVAVTSSTGTSAVINAASISTSGVMSAADKAKLDTLQNTVAYTDEQARDAAASMIVNGAHSGITVAYNDSTDQLNITVPVATTLADGLLSAADKQKLDATTSTMTVEGAQDLVGDMFTSSSHVGLTATYNDALGTISLAVSPIPSATQSIAGLLSAADKTRLDNFASPPLATTAVSGLMSATDKSKLDAYPIVPVTQFTNEMAQDTAAAMILSGTHTGVTAAYNDTAGTLSLTVPASSGSGVTNLTSLPGLSTVTVSSSTGTAAVIPAATAGAAGVMTSADKTKLDATPNTFASQYTDEMAQDALAAMLAAGTHTGISYTYNDAANALSLIVAGATPTSAPTNSGLPVVSGAMTVGTVVSSSQGSWQNSPTSYTYQWLRNGAIISGATLQYLTLAVADTGTAITCRVTAANAGGSTSATSISSGVVTDNPTAAAPTNTSLPVIIGSNTTGSILSAVTGSWTGSPTSYAYQWKRGATNISGAIFNTYTVVAADAGTNLTIYVVATNSTGSGNATSVAFAIPGAVTAPTNTVIPVISGTATVGSTLSTTTGTWTNSPAFTYQWLRAGVAISGATSPTYTLVAADAGTAISVRVNGANSAGSASATSTATVAVTAVPVNTALPSISGIPLVGNVLTAGPGTWTNNPSSYTYQWKRAGVNIGGSISTTYTVLAGDIGQPLTVSVAALNSTGTSATSTSASVTPAAAPTNTVAPTIAGTPSVNNVVSVSNGTWTGSPTFSYQWQRAGVNIVGGTSGTYVMVLADVGQSITCRVTGTNAAGTLNVVTAAVTGLPGATQVDTFANPVSVAMTGSNFTYDVGPGKPYTLDTIPWCTLVAGDVVNIFYQAAPYKVKFALRGQGTAAAPIVVNGVTDASGNRPVFDFNNATSAPLTVSPAASSIFTNTPAYGEILGGIIVKAGPNDDYFTYRPKFIQFRNLEITGVTNGNSFTTTSAGGGGTAQYGLACGIFFMKAMDCLVENCVIYTCSFGLFVMAKDGLRSWSGERITLRNSRIFGCGTVGTWFDHGVYNQTVNPLTEGCWFGVNRTGSLGSTYKDRSSGAIIRYNTFENSARNLDLVHSEEQSTDGVATMPDYGQDYVYGNSFVNDYRIGGGITYAAIHFGGDNLGEESPGASEAANDAIAAFPYRKNLFYWNNTFVVNLPPSAVWNDLVFFDLSSKAQNVHAWNNIWAVYGVAQPGTMAWLENAGTLNLIGTNQLYVQTAANVIQDARTSPTGRFAVNRMGTIVTSNPGFVDVSNYDYSILDAANAVTGQNVAAQVAAIPNGGARAASLAVEYSPRVRTSGMVARGSTNLGAMGTNALAPTNVGAPPTITYSALTTGSVLTGSSGGWSNSPSFAYQWKRAGVNIAGATATTYTLVAADAGSAITFAVTATANSITVTAVSTAVQAAALVGAPSNTAIPAITGTPSVGETLTATTGTWTGSPTSYTYQWFAAGVSIAAASAAAALVLQPAQQGTVITVQVVAMNGIGNASAASVATAAVTAAPASPLVSFSAYTDGTLLSATGSAGIWGSTYGTAENRYTVLAGALRCLTGTGNYGAEVWRADVTGDTQAAELTMNANDLLSGGSVVASLHAGGVTSSWVTLNATNATVSVNGVQAVNVAHGVNMATTASKLTVKQAGGTMSFILNGVVLHSVANSAADGHPSLVMYNSTGEGQAQIRSFSTLATQ